MPTTARAAWIDAWEGACTPSPVAHRSAVREIRETRESRESARVHPLRYQGRDAEYTPSLRQHEKRQPARVRTARQRRKEKPGQFQEAIFPERATPSRVLVATSEYDWEAAARMRPARDVCERVILHDEVAARMHATRYYGREATARLPEPWPEAERAQTLPPLRAVRRRQRRGRLVLLALTFAVLLVGGAVVAPVMMSSAVAGVEAAVGQTEAAQEQLAGETAALAAQISALSAPQRVQEQAAQLGLAPAQDVSYLPTDTGIAGMLASEGDTTVAGR
jgi:hypothetical protein